MKGAAVQLGVTEVGRRGPFGARGEEEELDDGHPDQIRLLPGSDADQPPGLTEHSAAAAHS
jgi:hypothetical protein